jgi:hypothetical protein
MFTYNDNTTQALVSVKNIYHVSYIIPHGIYFLQKQVPVQYKYINTDAYKYKEMI